MINMHYSHLKVWQKAMSLAVATYRITEVLPRNEQYGLTSQMRRAAVSIASNIAEGSQRKSEKDFAHFILIARGSLAELQTQLLLAQQLTFITEQQRDEGIKSSDEVSRMLFGLYKTLSAHSSQLAPQ